MIRTPGRPRQVKQRGVSRASPPAPRTTPEPGTEAAGVYKLVAGKKNSAVHISPRSSEPGVKSPFLPEIRNSKWLGIRRRFLPQGLPNVADDVLIHYSS